MMWNFAAVFLLSTVCSSKDDFNGDVVLKIIPKTNAEVRFLKKLVDESKFELDVWKETSHPYENVDIHVKAKHVLNMELILRSSGIDFTVMIKDVQEAIMEETLSNQKLPTCYGYNYNKYNEYWKIKAELRNLVQTYPGRATHFSVGLSYEMDEINGVQITAGNTPGSKPVIWIDGGIHAREWISPATVMWFIRYLLTDNTPNTRRALEKYDFYILPVFNVDGYKYTFRGGRARMWRKTRKPYGLCYGADPNRNWSYKFGGEGSSSNPCSEIYRGPRAFSEVEVDQVARYLKSIPNLKSYYNVHSYGQLVLTPWAYTSSPPQDYSEIKRVGDVFAQAVGKHGTYYQVGPPSRFAYNAAGGSIDWTYGELGVIYSYALELRDTGRYGLLLPAHYIPISGKETSEAVIEATLAMN